MKYLLPLVTILPFTLAQPAQAASLDTQLTHFFTARLAGVGDDVTVTVRTPEDRRPACEQPVLSMPPSARLWGNLSVVARCGSETRYVQVRVSATGEYAVAAQSVPRGTRLTPDSVMLKRGRLDKLPPQAIRDLQPLRAAVTLRDLTPGQPIVESMVRPVWRVRAGQRVTIVVTGEGFSVRSEGTALNNAAVSQPVRARLASGQLLSGNADESGTILIVP